MKRAGNCLESSWVPDKTSNVFLLAGYLNVFYYSKRDRNTDRVHGLTKGTEMNEFVVNFQ